ncbi:MAG TPA: DCC1-like thiol-disulfide oxidoreductase family protein [Candidatus Micrarchaeaceae archaeon]|nr:DCC1-like thiol-disulfide oxidoreductase family protein [Candidatus Micrarchaeaceae archaeon]
MADGGVTLVYDGECEFCARLARWVERRDGHGRVSVRANQEAGLIEALGLTRGEADRAAWAVDEGGRRFEGAAAINRALRALGGGWFVLGSLYRVAPFKWVEDRYYWRVARRRAWW